MKRLFELMQSFGGGGTVGSTGGQEDKRSSYLKIVRCYCAKALRSILSIIVNLNVSDGTATFPLALWERGQLCEQSELTTAGEGLIRCKDAKRHRC